MGLQKKKSSGTDYQQVIQESLRKRDYAAAIGAFRALLKIKDSAQMRLRYADTLVLAGRKEDALAEYRQAAEEMAQQGQLVLAIATFKKLAKLDPGQADILENIARLHAERGVAQPPAPVTPTLSGGDDRGVEFGMEAGDGADLDIGFGMEAMSSEPMIELGVSDEISSTLAPELEPDDLGVDDLAVGDLDAGDLDAGDLDAGDLAASDLGADDLATSDAAVDLSSNDLGADDAELASDFAPSGAPDFAPQQAAEVANSAGGFGFDFGGGAAAPAPVPAAQDSTAGFGFDFGGGSTAAPAPVAATASGLGFDFGATSSPQEPSAAAPGKAAEPAFGFNFGQPEFTPPATSDVTTAAMEPKGFGMSFAPAAAGTTASPIAGLNEVFPGAGEMLTGQGGFGESPFGGDDDAGNLLDLLGDDIEMMIDGIISDVGDNSSTQPVALGTMETNIRLFSHLAIDEFVEVLKLLDREVVKAGQEIVRQGDSGASMYIISDGTVDAVVSRDGQDVKIATLADGDFFGEMSVLSGGPRTATIRASKDTELLVLQRDKLQEIFTRYPEIEAKLRLAHDERAEALSRR